MTPNSARALSAASCADALCDWELTGGFPVLDSNANPQPHALSRLQWHNPGNVQNSVGRGLHEPVEGNVERCCRRRYGLPHTRRCTRSYRLTVLPPGPAHAVYFATYEAVKHLMGGNKLGEHHPLAAGRST